MEVSQAGTGLSRFEYAYNVVTDNAELHPTIRVALSARALCFSESLPLPKPLTLAQMAGTRARLAQQPTLAEDTMAEISAGKPTSFLPLDAAFRHWLPESAYLVDSLVNHEASRLLIHALCDPWPKPDAHEFAKVANATSPTGKRFKNLLTLSLKLACEEQISEQETNLLILEWFHAAPKIGEIAVNVWLQKAMLKVLSHEHPHVNELFHISGKDLV